MKQYNPKKPHKWGFKVFVLSVILGFSYKFKIFSGSAGCKYIFQRDIQIGTVRKNRLQKSPIPSDGNMKKKGKGAYVERIETIESVELSLVSWYDNQIIPLL